VSAELLGRSPKQRAVLRIVRRFGSVTRAQIGLHGKLSAEQVNTLTSELMKLGLIEIERDPSRTGERAAVRVRLARKSHATIGLDIGSQRQVAVVANLRGETVAGLEESKPLPADGDALIDHLTGFIERAIAQSGLGESDVLGVCAAFRAIVDTEPGVITRGPEASRTAGSWSNVPVRDQLLRRLPWELIVIEDTVRVLAAVEARHGFGACGADFVYVLVDSGVGAAIIIDGKPYVGPSGLSGEFGHITFNPLGNDCSCGKRGCIEAYTSVAAVLGRANCERPGIACTIAELDGLAEGGDPLARRALEDAGAVLGQGLVTLLNVLGPRLIVISGALSESVTFVNAASQTAKMGALDQAARDLRVVPSRLGPLAGASGAAAIVLDQLLETRN
jgi:predicted NBD/HSP70 family sugar kinase